MISFNEQSSSANNVRLIPAGALVACLVNVRAIKVSQSSGARYADLEFQVIQGEHEKHKFWTNVMDPTPKASLPPGFEEHKEGGRRMGYGAIARMLEASGLVQVGNPASYNAVAGAFPDVIARLHGKVVAVKIGIEKGTGAFADKNVVADYLSPNPQSGGHKLWLAMVGGATMDPGMKAAAPAATAASAWAGQSGAPAAPTAPQPQAPQPQPPVASALMFPTQQPTAPLAAAASWNAAPPGASPIPAVTAPALNIDKPAGWLQQAQAPAAGFAKPPM